MLERQRDGIEKAKQTGVKFGRPALSRSVINEARKLREEGIGPSDIAKRL